MFENVRIMELKVMKSSAGYYLGREITEKGRIPMTYIRQSDYFECNGREKTHLRK